MKQKDPHGQGIEVEKINPHKKKKNHLRSKGKWHAKKNKQKRRKENKGGRRLRVNPLLERKNKNVAPRQRSRVEDECQGYH